MTLKFLEIETSLKSKVNQNFSAPNQHRSRKEPVLEIEDECIEEEKDQEVWTHFLQIQGNHFFDLRGHLETFCSVPPVLSFNNAKNHINIPKS